MQILDGCCVLVKSSCGTSVCNGSELGFSYATMIKRFDVPFSRNGNPRTHLGTMPSGNIDPTRTAMLTAHLETARGWPDLINRLVCEGMELRLVGAELGIYKAATGRHLCNTATIGAPHETLERRYGKPVPLQSLTMLDRQKPSQLTKQQN